MSKVKQHRCPNYIRLTQPRDNTLFGYVVGFPGYSRKSGGMVAAPILGKASMGECPSPLSPRALFPSRCIKAVRACLAEVAPHFSVMSNAAHGAIWMNGEYIIDCARLRGAAAEQPQAQRRSATASCS